jgi:hypothetical protein
MVAIMMLAGVDASAAVSSYTSKVVDGRTVLTSVTVQRGGRTVIFDASKLIGAKVVHFRSDVRGTVAFPTAGGKVTAEDRVRLLDLTLNSGLINPAAGTEQAQGDWKASEEMPGLVAAFDEPVVNLPGDDVVLFEVQREKASPLAGDPVHVMAPRSEGGQRRVTIRSYDITFDHPKARFVESLHLLQFPRPVQSVAELKSGTLSIASRYEGFKALAVGIDLSALGCEEGASVSRLALQTVSGCKGMVDPVCLVGLPRPVAPHVFSKEPATPKPGAALLKRFLAGSMADVDEIVFALRVPGRDHWYANFGYYSSPVREYPPQRAPDGVRLPAIFQDGGRLCRFNLRSKKLMVLLEDPKGGVRDPQVHYDGQKILFSYRKGGQPYYHLYEIDVDGGQLSQLTDGPYNDIEPTYLPDGAIMFCSDRCRRFVNCWVTPVATLYRCEADGSQIRMVSTNVEHDNTPWVLSDGRVLYMRWEYVDRNQLSFHHLWTTNPDGTGQMVFYGNQRPGVAMLDAKPIPGTNKVVASFSPGHGRPEHAGYVTVVDPRLGPDEANAVRRISRGDPSFRDPYALSEDCFLVARGREILAMDAAGNTASLYRLPDAEKKLHCHEPRPLRRRTREPVISAHTDVSRDTGRLVLADVHEGRNMAGVQRGQIKELLILEQLPKPVNFSGGMWPISVGGTFTLARVMGVVPVEEDGSAYMELPALRSFFFVALDEQGLSVKRMQSFLSVQPGEVMGCVGCHEQRLRPPLAEIGQLAATGRGPSRIRPFESVPDVLDFPRDIQPILDRHCVPCHSPDRFEGRVDLCGDRTPLFSQSYWTIMERGLVADGRNEPAGNRPPRMIGSSASRLMNLIDGTHYDTKLSKVERDTIRLWIESSAVYAGTYAALGSGMYPVEFPVKVMERRCGSCHGSKPPAKRRIGKSLYFRFGGNGPALPLVHTFSELKQIRATVGYYKFGNSRPPQSLCRLSRPEASLLVRAPLAKEAGGLGICEPAVFTGIDDSDYLAMLRSIRKAGRELAAAKRFDMSGFRPNDYYVFQMQRYGILPKALGSTDPIDCYAVDRAYWKSLWYRPAPGGG